MRPIDADHLKETLTELDVESADLKWRKIMLDAIQKVFPALIDDEPTIDMEPQESEWQIVALRTKYDDIPYGHSFVCKNCGHTEGRNKKYCGGCGCKMIGVDYG